MNAAQAVTVYQTCLGPVAESCHPALTALHTIASLQHVTRHSEQADAWSDGWEACLEVVRATIVHALFPDGQDAA